VVEALGLDQELVPVTVWPFKTVWLGSVLSRAVPRAVMCSYLRFSLAPAATGARSLHISNKSTFGHAGRVAAGDDDVIQDADVDEP
jgi:hypothetical protein